MKKTPKWFTKKAFIAWLKTKPAKNKYDYFDNHNCPIAQFLKQRFPDKTVFVGGKEFNFDGKLSYDADYEIPEWLYDPVDVAETYGELLESLTKSK